MHQEHTSMKVCTDACLFGAWTAKDLKKIGSENILDIGTGTGLLSLMLAQAKPNSKITAVEMEPLAAAEAEHNFKLSPWKTHLKLVQDKLQQFANNKSALFDIIITNPPFYEGDLKSPNENKNKAAHSTELPWNILAETVSNLLKQGGIFYTLVPTIRAYTMQKLCTQQGLQLMEETLVYNTAKNRPIRAMQKFTKQIVSTAHLSNHTILRTNLYIKDADQNYTPEFTTLLKEYYLYL